MLAKSRLKYIQTLGQKKFREQERMFIAEGPTIVSELLTTRATIVKEIFAVKNWINENNKLLRPGITVAEITEKELDRISQLTTPNQVLAIVRQFDSHASITTKSRITLVLDTIRDPGNLGTIIRIADWFGIEQIVCAEDSTDLYNPKVVQATMGSIARVKVFYTDLRNWLSQQKDVRIYAAVLEGQDISTMKKLQEGIILIGNESKGIRGELLQLANVRITIPGKGKAESLNAAIATGIILFQLC